MHNSNEPLGCLYAILQMLGIVPSNTGTSSPVELPYQRKDYLLTRAERSFFGVLQNAVGTQYLIFAKVRLADLLFIRKGAEKRQTHFNRIQAKHIDFVLCDHKVVRPLLAIELDDSSHNRADRQDRDTFVDAALGTAGLPILRVRVRSGYNVADLANAIHQSIHA